MELKTVCRSQYAQCTFTTAKCLSMDEHCSSNCKQFQMKMVKCLQILHNKGGLHHMKSTKLSDNMRTQMIQTTEHLYILFVIDCNDGSFYLRPLPNSSCGQVGLQLVLTNYPNSYSKCANLLDILAK